MSVYLTVVFSNKDDERIIIVLSGREQWRSQDVFIGVARNIHYSI